MVKILSLIAVAGFIGVSMARDTNDSVTIPKSRLEELERKAAELDNLKKTNPPPTAVAPQPAVPASPGVVARPVPAVHAPSAAPSVVVYPEVKTLPPLKPDDVIDAGMLAAHFKQDPQGAEKRYLHRKFKLSGVISGFDRTPFIRSYKVILRAAGAEIPVVCGFYPPDQYKAVYSANDGTSLMATRARDEAQITLARVGQTVVIEGECRGAKPTRVSMTGCRFVESGK